MVSRRIAGRINSTILRKGATVPKKPVALPVSDHYVVLYTVNGDPHWQEYIGARDAVNGYRLFRQFYGDNVRMTQVVFDYGKEV